MKGKKVTVHLYRSCVSGLFIVALATFFLVADFFLVGSYSFAYERFTNDYSVVQSTLQTEMRVELLPKRQATLSSEMAAIILKIEPREGHQFKKDATLVVFDCAMEMAQMQRARAILNAAEAKSKVNKRLSHLQATSKLEEQVAKADVAKARAELAIIQVKIDRCKIKAPFSGRVVMLLSQQHQYVKAGDPLMEILDEQSLEVVFLLPSRQRHNLILGDHFQILIDETQRSYPARIIAFGAMIDSVSQSVKVFGTIDGDFPELLPGMSGVAQFLAKDAKPEYNSGPIPSLPSR